jgi:hypothetical protein
MLAKNFEVQLLLVLWELGGVEVAKGQVNKRFSGRTAQANTARERLVGEGAIAVSPDGKRLTLTEPGKAWLRESLAGDGFQFEAQIGAKMANALLRLWRSQPSSGAIAAGQGDAIASYEAFKLVALETYDRLNRDFNLDNLVAIYRIRREIGERVTRSQFSEWLFEMQSEDVFQLLEGSVEDNTPDKLEDSVQTKLGKLRCYAKRIAA